jgi:hypothetical protein
VSLVRLARTIHLYVRTVYIRYISREITMQTAIYGVYLCFWPALVSSHQVLTSGKLRSDFEACESI